MKTLIQILALLVLAVLLAITLARGIDKSFENQDRMLCESAKVSGNEEYLKKCQCYYNGSPISCIRQEEISNSRLNK